MLQWFDGWKFLAGLGIFLFGMFMMEESIKLLAGRSLKALLRRFTGTRLSALLTGIVSTAVLQSSSAVSLMVLAFVGAGLLTLGHAIAVIMGAMVGTTLTAWIVAVFGFSFKIDALALPMIGIGGLGLIVLGHSQRYVHFSKLVAAFGFLFLGLDYMKTSVEAMTASLDLSSLPDLGLWIYVMVGTVLTAIMQSSSAAIAVTLTAIFAGVIDFGQGAAMVIGANIGTTVTILIGAIGGIPAKKQAAVSSLVFNVGTALVVTLTLPLLLSLIGLVFDPENNAVLGIAAFHTLFNCIGALIFFPAIPVFECFLKRLFPEKRAMLTIFIQNTSTQVPEAAMIALRKEILHQLSLSLAAIARLYALTSKGTDPETRAKTGPVKGTGQNGAIRYDDLEDLHAEIFAFYARMQAHGIAEPEALQLEPVIRGSRSIMNATKNLFELHPEIEDFGRDDTPFMVEAHEDFKHRLAGLVDRALASAQIPEAPGMDEELKAFFKAVENEDKRFIGSCSKAIAHGAIQEREVTRLLMTNRFFTQSSRMVILSLQAVIRGFSPTGARPQEFNDIVKP
ncbi:MAG: Na/Pi cotransporter family protein [Deltaproteobacteria bacterium]|nr:Na/Pi cotransporter family protein [Deltaproteobacteria bacterium]